MASLKKRKNQRINEYFMTCTGASVVFDTLEFCGVKHVFGYPGGCAIPLYDELATRMKKKAKIRHFLTAHEQGADWNSRCIRRQRTTCGDNLQCSKRTYRHECISGS